MRNFFAVVAVLFIVGCGSDRHPPTRSSVTIGYCCGFENPLNPWEDASAKLLVFLPMARFDEHGELRGRLARSWQPSRNWRTVTYHLRTEVRWQDGRRVTAHDVKFTLDLLGHPDVLNPDIADSVTVHNDSTVSVHFRGYPEFFNIATVFYPKHLLEHLDPKEFYRWNFWREPVGNGPYRLVRSVPNTMFEFEANPDYYRGKPRIARVLLKLVDKAAVTDLLAGRVDAMTFSNPAALAKLASDPRFRSYHRIFELVSRAIYWNARLPLFEQAEVRRALTHAINRRALFAVLNLPSDLPVFDGVYTDQQLRRGQLPPALPYDTAQAKALLDKAGWRDRDGDGVRERNGAAFRFTALLPMAAGFPEMAILVQSQLRTVGVRMELQVVESSSIVYERLRSGSFEAAFHQFRNTGWHMHDMFGPTTPIGYTNAALLPLIERVKLEANPNERDPLYRQIADVLRHDQPLTFLHPHLETNVVHRRLRGLSRPFHANPVWYLEDLWLEDES